MYSFKTLSSLVFGRPEDPLCRSLRASDVPVSTADCRACADPCDLGQSSTGYLITLVLTSSITGHEAYPRRFDIDMDTNMLGSVKPYHRQVRTSSRLPLMSYHETNILFRSDCNFNGEIRLGT